jgi:hypothetical protein
MLCEVLRGAVLHRPPSTPYVARHASLVTVSRYFSTIALAQSTPSISPTCCALNCAPSLPTVFSSFTFTSLFNFPLTQQPPRHLSQ